MASVNIIKRIKVGNRWKFFAIPRNEKGAHDWQALPEGRYYLEWYLAGKRRRDFRERSMSRHNRATTVVNQPLDSRLRSRKSG